MAERHADGCDGEWTVQGGLRTGLEAGQGRGGARAHQVGRHHAAAREPRHKEGVCARAGRGRWERKLGAEGGKQSG